MKMRRLFLAIAIMAASVTVTKAQFYIGGGLGFWYDKPNVWFNISPEAGYSFNKHWTAGLSVGFDYQKDSPIDLYYSGKTTRISFSIEPYARFNYFSTDRINLFLDGVVGVSVNQSFRENFKSDPNVGFQVIIRPGIAVNLNEHFSLVATFGALGYRHNYSSLSNGFGFNFSNSLRFGFYYSF